MAPDTHTHRAQPNRARTLAYHGPVRAPHNARAHGGFCQLDTCACGATRKSNRNQGAIEMGRWSS